MRGRDVAFQVLVLGVGVVLTTLSTPLVRFIGLLLIIGAVSWFAWDFRKEGRLTISPALLIVAECVGIFALVWALYLSVSRLYAAPITWSFQQDGYAVPINWDVERI